MHKEPWQIFREDSALAAAAAAGENLNNFLAENKNQPVLLLLSAGSALLMLDYVGQTALGKNLTIGMLDDRFSQDPKINNFIQMQRTEFYGKAQAAEVNFFGSLPRPEETMEDLAQRMEKNLSSWRKKNLPGIIAATLGMGPDGHTAGIFPCSDSGEFNRLFSSDNWICAYNVGGKHRHKDRVTATITFFKHIDFGFAYACGADKQSKFGELAKNEKPPAELPAAAWREIKDVKIFTDLK